MAAPAGGASLGGDSHSNSSTTDCRTSSFETVESSMSLSLDGSARAKASGMGSFASDMGSVSLGNGSAGVARSVPWSDGLGSQQGLNGLPHPLPLRAARPASTGDPAVIREIVAYRARRALRASGSRSSQLAGRDSGSDLDPEGKVAEDNLPRPFPVMGGSGPARMQRIRSRRTDAERRALARTAPHARVKGATGGKTTYTSMTLEEAARRARQRRRRKRKRKRRNKTRTLKELVAGGAPPLGVIHEGVEGEDEGDEALPKRLVEDSGLSPEQLPMSVRLGQSEIVVHVPESTLNFTLTDSIASIFFGNRIAKALARVVRRGEGWIPVLQLVPVATANLVEVVFRRCSEDRSADPATSTCTLETRFAAAAGVLYGISAATWLALLLTENVEIFKVALQKTSIISVVLVTILFSVARGHIALYEGYFGVSGCLVVSCAFMSGLCIATGDALAISDRCILHRYTTALVASRHIMSVAVAGSASFARPGTRVLIHAGNLDFSNVDVEVACRIVLVVAFLQASYQAWRDPNAFTFIQAKLRTTFNGPVLVTTAVKPGRIAPRSLVLRGQEGVNAAKINRRHSADVGPTKYSKRISLTKRSSWKW